MTRCTYCTRYLWPWQHYGFRVGGIDSGGATRSRTAVHGPIRSPISGTSALGWLVKGKAVDDLREWPAGVPKHSEDAGAPPVHLVAAWHTRCRWLA